MQQWNPELELEILFNTIEKQLNLDRWKLRIKVTSVHIHRTMSRIIDFAYSKPQNHAPLQF